MNKFIFSHKELWAAKGCRNIGEEIFVLCFFFCSIDIFEMFLCEHGRQICHYLRVLVFISLNDTHEELWWNTEPKHAVNE